MPNDSASGGYLVPENGTPTLSDDDVFDGVLHDLVVGCTGLPGRLVRPRWQPTPIAEPEVATDWCAIGVVDETPESMPFVTHRGADDGGQGADFVQVNDEVQVLASFYGPNARQNAKALRNGLMVAQNRELLTRLNMGLVAMPSPARFIPAIVSMQTQRRVDVTFAIRRADVIQVPVRNIATVQGVLNTDAPAKEWPFEQGSTPPP